MYHFQIANDNGNSEHKILINKSRYQYPNVYAVIYSPPGESDEPLERVIENLHNNMDVRIETKGISNRYLVGPAALASANASDIYNMAIENVKKHEENIPLVNTLAIVAVEATKRQFYQAGKLVNGEFLQVSADMTTALPASIHDAESEKKFRELFTSCLHEVKVYVKDISVNVQIKFNFVKVLKEGIPALFAIIEDGEENYRDDDMFTRFKLEYKHPVLDGSYFLDKRMLHVDIGDGSTELVYTSGYSADPLKSSGEKFGLGQAIEKSCIGLSKLLNKDISRQQISQYLKNRSHKFHKKAMNELLLPKKEVAEKVYQSIIKRLESLTYEVDVIAVYGGASILLEDVLYQRLVNTAREFEIEVLWIPEGFAVEMNMLGMEIFNTIKLDELIQEADAARGEVL